MSRKRCLDVFEKVEEPMAKRVYNSVLTQLGREVCDKNAAEMRLNWRRAQGVQPYSVCMVDDPKKRINCWVFSHDNYGYFVDVNRYLATQEIDVYKFTDKMGQHLEVDTKIKKPIFMLPAFSRT